MDSYKKNLSGSNELQLSDIGREAKPMISKPILLFSLVDTNGKHFSDKDKEKIRERKALSKHKKHNEFQLRFCWSKQKPKYTFSQPLQPLITKAHATDDELKTDSIHTIKCFFKVNFEKEISTYI